MKTATLFLVIILSSAGFFHLQAQEFVMSGIVTDTLDRPLELANLITIPNDKSNQMKFTVTDNLGRYTISLSKNTQYSIAISFLGFKKRTDTVKLNEDTVYNFKMIPNKESLEEVVLKKRRAILVKEDTITFRVESFINGDERKLREVLKKLPGVEVDREGNVKVNGEKVQKLLVEGRTFFTGDTKLGVNNIPSDVIDEIEILSNYSDNPILKGLVVGNTLAINVKLQEDKKNFIFGDIVGGYGIDDRYVLSPKLFRYGSKTNINFIGDVNNIGEKAFSFQDYLSFEGGNSILLRDPVAYSKIVNSDFVSSLRNNDFLYREDYFGAINMDHVSSSKMNLSFFSINNYSLTDRSTENNLLYVVNNDFDLTENRLTASSDKNFFTLNKFVMDYTPSLDSKLSYQLILKGASGRGQTNLNSISTEGTEFVSQRQKPSSFQLLNRITFDKRFSERHTSSVLINFEFLKSNDRNNWQFSEPIFTNIFQVEGESPFLLDQQINSKIFKGTAVLKHYWAINNANHIYASFGFSHLNENYISKDQQIIDNTPNPLDSVGFDNDTGLLVNDAYVGIEYKTRISNIVIRSGLFYHYYSWDVNQFQVKQTSRSKPQLIPELDLNWKFSNSERLNFNYTLKSVFGDAFQYANRLRFNKFNMLYRGNSNLENNLSHQFLLAYNKYNLSKGIFYFASLNYTIQSDGIRNSSTFDGVDQISTVIYNDIPADNLLLNGSVSKLMGKLRGTLGTNLLISNYSKFINDDVNRLKATNFGIRLDFETFFKEAPNFELGVNTDFTNVETSGDVSRFIRTEPFMNVKYKFLKDFIFEGDYSYTIYNNKDQNIRNEFQIGSASMFYSQEDSAWGFELDVNNLFDVRSKNESLISSFVAGDTQNFIQPRTFLIKINYKL